MTLSARYTPYPAAATGNRIQRSYGAFTPYQQPAQVTTSKFRSRTSGLSVIKQTRTMKIDHPSGRVTKNLFAQRSQSDEFGIASSLFCAAVVRRKDGQPASLLRVLEDTIVCETVRDNTRLDIYLAWEGMLGTTTDNGRASFNFGLMTAYGDTLKMLSRADVVNRMGARTCKGRSSLKDIHIADKGTQVTFVIHREIRLDIPDGPNAISEIHFEKPDDNFFKIITH